MTCERTFCSKEVNAGMLNTSAIHKLLCSEKPYRSLIQVRGLPAYWSSSCDTLAMMHSIGIPTWFLTMSAAEFHWPEILQAIGLQWQTLHR